MTTQVGHGKDTRLSEEEIRGEQLFLVMSHSGGLGRPLPAHWYVPRWPFGSMGSPAAARAPRGRGMLAAMLNAGVHPVVPEIGSVGAADIGKWPDGPGRSRQGRAEYHGEVFPAARRCAGRDHPARTQRQGRAGTDLSQRGLHRPCGAGCRSGRAGPRPQMSLRRSPWRRPPPTRRSCILPWGAPSPSPDSRGGRSPPGAAAGSGLFEPGVARSVQDALSFRVVPQVHGALREYVAAARNAVTVELKPPPTTRWSPCRTRP